MRQVEVFLESCPGNVVLELSCLLLERVALGRDLEVFCAIESPQIARSVRHGLVERHVVYYFYRPRHRIETHIS